MSSTPYLILFTLLGGGLALFIAAGWSSYKENKLPENSVLFRWFVAGSFACGVAAYAYLFGAGGDPTSMFQSIGESLEIKEVVETLTSAVASGATVAAAAASAASAASSASVASSSGENQKKPRSVSESGEELKIGMPNF
jgi:Na+/proline symporter